MADVREKSKSGSTADKHVSPQKRKVSSDTDDDADTPSNKVSKVEPLVSGKISMSLGKMEPAGSGKISMSLGKMEPAGSGKISMLLGKMEPAGSGKKPGMSMNIGLKKPSMAPIKMALSSQPVKEVTPVKPKTHKVASVFNEESDSEEEEMPMEAKMRMRNVGRHTKTAAGPNSFGKGNLGFCDRNKMIERDLKKQMQEYGEKADA